MDKNGVIDIRMYQDSDFGSVAFWHWKRGIDLSDRSLLPKIGFIVPDVAAGFVYLTDSAVAFIEGYVTNPNATLRERNSAIDAITECLIAHAATSGVRVIKCETRFNGIRRKAEKFGFRDIGKTTSMVKEI